MFGQAASDILLHGRGLKVKSVVARVGGEAIAGSWEQIDPSGVARLRFPSALPAGPVTLAFDYDAPFNTGPSGMFRVKVGGDWYSWTQFESIDARSAFPCFDQPSFKTPFTVTLRTPPGLVAVSNAPEASTTREGRLDVHRFAPTLPLPTYLVAMMTGPFAVLAGEVPPTPQRATPLPLRIISTKQNAGKLAFALAGTKQIVALLEDYFGEAFPYPKLDQVTSPVMPGAMENAGADLYQDRLLVMDANAPVEQQRAFGIVVSHELAHQWFGDLVTPAWWDDIWLNESFAAWMGHRIGNAWRPDLNIGSGLVADGFSAMDTDALAAGRPIRQRIETSEQADGAFDSITYGKGAHVITMVADYLGDETFRARVRRYMAAHRYGNATSADFFAALGAAAGDPRIVAALRSFTDQQGVPLLSFAREGDQVTITQHRYIPLGTTAADALWSVPVCMRRGGTRTCVLLTGRSGRFTVPGEGPLVPNAGGAGYYRFDLPDSDWDALIEDAGALSEGEALAIGDSLAAGIRAGKPGVERLAQLAHRLVRRPETGASDAATHALAEIARSGAVDSAGRQAWRGFLGKLYAPLLSSYGFNPKAGAYAGESPERMQRRAQVVDWLLASTRSWKLHQKLAGAAEKFFSGKKSALDPAWYEDAFGAFLKGGGVEVAKAYGEVALDSEDPDFRPAMLDALSESGNKAIAHWLLYDFHDPRLRPSEQRELLGGVLLTRDTRDLGYDWLRANIGRLTSDREGIFFVARLPRLLGRFCSAADADEIGRDLRPHFAGQAGEIELERVIEKIRDCGVLKDRHGAALTAEFAAIR